MVFFTVMLKLLVFGFCAAVVLSIIVYVPLALYIIPYCLWVGFQNNAGRHKDKKKESVFRSARNATRLYIAWICRKEPTF